ncbi:uncharacterized protein BDZ99DRAFT_562284 [Mytilinidion resinicola]|uniref:Zn(2)-C6 fungal-type domain-containing protein n=1 Tax=Mytilinidion resinicola TaxID=574789 RepID=A0A6A6YQN3_9PEZI|nr:uncharacterized protein BDZ99DRAFT_562284 [Mytilinidion resinicola]KAF2811216.1 hypothetical protein BDZ99DRAFT_562284 [Mytilinidion resinicola]
MDAYTVRPCPICQSDHWVLTEDDEKGLWALFSDMASLSTIEREKLREVLQDMSASKTCASQAAARNALAAAEQERDDQIKTIAELERERDAKKKAIAELERKLRGQERALKQNEDLHMGIEEKWEEGKKAKDNRIAALRYENMQLANQLERAQGRDRAPISANNNQRHGLQRRGQGVADLRRKGFVGAAPTGIAKSRHAVAAPKPVRNLRDRAVSPLTGVNVHPLPTNPTAPKNEHNQRHMAPRGGDHQASGGRGRKLTCKKCYALKIDCSGGYPCKLCKQGQLTCKYSVCAYFNTEMGCVNPDCGFIHDEKGYRVR